jgi:hypothetical protein
MAMEDLTFRSHIGITTRIHITTQKERLTVLGLVLYSISLIDAAGPSSLRCARLPSTLTIHQRLILKKFECFLLSPMQHLSLQHRMIAGVQNHSQDMVIHLLMNLPRLFLDTRPHNIPRHNKRYIHRLHDLSIQHRFSLPRLKSRIPNHTLCITEEIQTHPDILNIFRTVTPRLRP